VSDVEPLMHVEPSVLSCTVAATQVQMMNNATGDTVVVDRVLHQIETVVGSFHFFYVPELGKKLATALLNSTAGMKEDGKARPRDGELQVFQDIPEVMKNKLKGG
jgi:hypothetical protein